MSIYNINLEGNPNKNCAVSFFSNGIISKCYGAITTGNINVFNIDNNVYQVVELGVVAPYIPINTGTNQSFFYIPDSMSGNSLKKVYGMVVTTGNTPITANIVRDRNGVISDLLSPRITIDAHRRTSIASTTQPIVVTGDLLSNDILRVDVNSTGTGNVVPNGLIIIMEIK